MLLVRLLERRDESIRALVATFSYADATVQDFWASALVLPGPDSATLALPSDDQEIILSPFSIRFGEILGYSSTSFKDKPFTGTSLEQLLVVTERFLSGLALMP